jgi:hypothetical protein
MNEPIYTRAQLIDVVQQVLDCDGTEEEVDQKIQWLEQNIADPNIIDYIFWTKEELTAEQIVDKALSYTPVML